MSVVRLYEIASVQTTVMQILFIKRRAEDRGTALERETEGRKGGQLGQGSCSWEVQRPRR